MLVRPDWLYEEGLNVLRNVIALLTGSHTTLPKNATHSIYICFWSLKSAFHCLYCPIANPGKSSFQYQNQYVVHVREGYVLVYLLPLSTMQIPPEEQFHTCSLLHIRTNPGHHYPSYLPNLAHLFRSLCRMLSEIKERAGRSNPFQPSHFYFIRLHQ